MIPENLYLDNLLLTERMANIPGDVYECGVWKGGMIAGIAELLGNSRNYYLFDSFEGLPPAKDIDGQRAIDYQEKKEDPAYFDNCAADINFATEAMNLTGANYTLTKGWFNQTLPLFKSNKPIAILRLDGDWYDSTLDCLTYLYPMVNHGGIIILDDYYGWDGCSKAVHDYLSSIGSASRIYKSAENVGYIIKNDNGFV